MVLYPKLILDALAKVRYPGTGKNIVEAGMVEDNLRIDGMKVSFSLLFEKPTDPFMKSLLKSAEAAIHTYVDKDVKVTITTRTLVQPKTDHDPVLPDVKNIIAIASGKGGVGKSTVASNLAVALTGLGYKVGLLDADIFGPSIPKMFLIENERAYAEEIDGKSWVIPLERYGVKLISIGFFIESGQATIWRGGMASSAIKQLITECAWGELDYLLIDLPPGTSDIHLTTVQTITLTGAIVVSTPQEVAISDARKAIDMFANEKISVPILGLVENMAWFTPAELPENKYYIFGEGGCARLANELHIPLLGQIPLVQSICNCGDAGMPVALYPNTLTGQAFRQLARQVASATNS